MLPLYVGVDIAGAENTWVARLVAENGALRLEQAPYKSSLAAIVQLADERDVVAVAIDGQLSISVADENGFRSSDYALRQLLPSGLRNWVASFNSLSAVPIRARILAETLSPTVATIIETHPRAALYFATTPDLDEAVRGYKKAANAPDLVAQLWQQWSAHFGIGGALGTPTDGALDAAVCATIAYLLHHQPDKLLRLRHDEKHKTGRGPFFVLRPDASD